MVQLARRELVHQNVRSELPEGAPVAHQAHHPAAEYPPAELVGVHASDADNRPLCVQPVPLAQVLLRRVNREALGRRQEPQRLGDRVDALRDVAHEAPHFYAVH